MNIIGPGVVATLTSGSTTDVVTPYVAEMIANESARAESDMQASFSAAGNPENVYERTIGNMADMQTTWKDRFWSYFRFTWLGWTDPNPVVKVFGYVIGILNLFITIMSGYILYNLFFSKNNQQ